jgi:hypothetical protein
VPGAVTFVKKISNSVSVGDEPKFLALILYESPPAKFASNVGAVGIMPKPWGAHIFPSTLAPKLLEPVAVESGSSETFLLQLASAVSVINNMNRFFMDWLFLIFTA